MTLFIRVERVRKLQFLGVQNSRAVRVISLSCAIGRRVVVLPLRNQRNEDYACELIWASDPPCRHGNPGARPDNVPDEDIHVITPAGISYSPGGQSLLYSCFEFNCVFLKYMFQCYCTAYADITNSPLQRRSRS